MRVFQYGKCTVSATLAPCESSRPDGKAWLFLTPRLSVRYGRCQTGERGSKGHGAGVPQPVLDQRKGNQSPWMFFFFKILCMYEHKQGRGRGSSSSALSRAPSVGLHPTAPGSGPELKAVASPASPPGAPQLDFQCPFLLSSPRSGHLQGLLEGLLCPVLGGPASCSAGSGPAGLPAQAAAFLVSVFLSVSLRFFFSSPRRAILDSIQLDEVIMLPP